MGYIPTMEEAQKLLEKYNQDSFLLKHAKIVSGILGYYAQKKDPENEEFWRVVGLLHDLDFEKYPQDHCKKTAEILQENEIDEKLIRAIVSHGYGIVTDVKPELEMEKVLFATDELSGLIGATAIMRPSKSLSDLEVKSVMKKFKTPGFAKGCSREVISQGAEMLGLDIKELIQETIDAMRDMGDEIL
ncbi:HDIG domain-containing metalloprotein [Alkalibacter mobilis]|uniref:HDIG domain-containing metalloprotein n=1 Tax=Alkalibacter mobilis TaxID=2787712 RepID=UPI00189D8AFF|nr:HDIG domain-containing metalloprotein [Alkalibacter mobilis]MBF7097157.1 HDIG domain-containing protein [Alkalibacter mobilis]